MSGARSLPATADRWRRPAVWMALLCAGLATVIFARRGLAAADAAVTDPGVAVTSGFEEESFFALWRNVHGQPVYSDPTRMPYASAYFNWLFYSGYALPVRAAVAHSGDAMIPLAGRAVTAAGALLGLGMLGWLLWRVMPGSPAAAAGLAAYVYFGPLVGWWAHSVRPDVWALALECSGLMVLLLHYRSRPVLSALAACLLFYGAWSFKQSNVLGLASAVLFLLIRRQRPAAAALVLGSGILWAATFAGLDAAYRKALLSATETNVFYLSHGLGNLRDMLLKSLPLWLMTGLLLLHRTRADKPAPLAADACLLGGAGLLISLGLSFAASCKLGAYSNYYFTAQLLLSLLTAGLFATRNSNRAAFAGFAAACGLLLLVSLGVVGEANLRSQSRELSATWDVWRLEPEPRYSAMHSLNEPWLNPGSPPLVVAYNYTLDRHAGKAFEAGGVGGLITAGYFRSLLLPAETGDVYDGGSLRHYARGHSLNGLTIFRYQATFSK